MSLLTVLLILWAAVTAVFAGLMMWRSLVTMREEDVVYLDPAEAKQAEEQKQIIAKVERITAYVKKFGIASAALLVVLGAVWLYQGLTAFSRGQTP